MILFPDLPKVIIEEVNRTDEIIFTLRTTSPTASCPCCGTDSSRIQSRYTRKMHDLPISGRPIRLVIHARRFFCHKSTCSQKIFTERLAQLCRPHAQRTTRVQETLCQLGLVVGGQPGERLGNQLGISGSRDTILRLVRQHPLPAPPSPRIIGLDDWAWKRRLRYGTLICDLEHRLPIELLPGRSVETVSAWLQEHPSIEIVSRDDSTEYASAITKGAPQAKQVSDRWHLIRNLAGSVSVLLAHCLTELRRAEPTAQPTGQEAAPLPQEHRARTRALQHVQQVRQAERLERSETMMALQKQGMMSAEIAMHMGMTPRTVRQWLSRGIPYSDPRRQRPRLLDGYHSYVLSRWEQGCHNPSQLEAELRARGYPGSQRAVYRYLATLEPVVVLPKRRNAASAKEQEASPATPSPVRTVSVQQLTWLLFRKPDELKDEERETLQVLR